MRGNEALQGIRSMEGKRRGGKLEGAEGDDMVGGEEKREIYKEEEEEEENECRQLIFMIMFNLSDAQIHHFSDAAASCPNFLTLLHHQSEKV